MQKTKRIMAVVLAALLSVGCTGCGDKGTPAAEGSAPAVSAEASAPASSAAAAEAGSWSAEGNYIDEAQNHLLLYHMSIEDGYDEEGWSTTFILGEAMYGGTTHEQDGTLTGTIATYKEDMTPDEEMEVTLTQEGEQVLMKTGDGTEYRFDRDETDYTALSGDMLPYFQYNQIYGDNSFDSVAAAAYDFLAFEKEKDYDPNHVMLPYVEVVDMDESNPQDVLVYGDYYLWEYEKQDDTLVAVSGGHCPGIIHMERFGEGETAIYSALSMDEAFTDDDAVTLFGERLEQYQAVASHPEVLEPKMAQVIADYVSANGLAVTKYQMSGEDAKELPLSK